jgi:hypothetical protein
VNDAPGVFAAVLASSMVAHNVADHWLQTAAQAEDKGLKGWRGRLACARHATVLTLTLAVVLAAVAAVTGMHLSLPAVAVGLAVNGVSHYWADRRFTLGQLADALGKGDFWALGVPRTSSDNPTLGTGAYALDQAWHAFWLLVMALIITGGSR